MTGVPVERWDVYARAPGGGNPCYLVRGPGAGGEQADVDLAGVDLAAAARLAARRFGAEAVLVGVRDGGPALRFFSPAGEMAMCGHATVAAVTALVASGRLAGTGAVASTPAGSFAVGWDGAEPPLVGIDYPDPRSEPAPAEAAEVAEVARSLGIAPGRLAAGRFRLASVARPKLLVPLVDAAAVHAAGPDPERLAALCRRLAATGAYLFAAHPDGRAGHLVARQFPVDAGVAEDPATGVAAGALAADLAREADSAGDGWSEIVVDQGDAMGRPSRLRAAARLTDGAVDLVRVFGSARLVGRESLPER